MMFRSRLFWFLLALLIVPHLGACQATGDCEKLLEANHVLRVDDAAKRLFVISGERAVADKESAAKGYVRSVRPSRSATIAGVAIGA